MLAPEKKGGSSGVWTGLDHQMSVAGGFKARAGGPNVPCSLGGAGPGRHTARSNASLVMATWTPCEHLGEQTDRHKRKHYLPATSLAGGKYIMYMKSIKTCKTITTNLLERYSSASACLQFIILQTDAHGMFSRKENVKLIIFFPKSSCTQRSVLYNEIML